MNYSSSNMTLVVQYRDSFTKAVAKNVIAVILVLSVNSINGMLIYTYHNHQIFHANPRYILFIHLVINDMIQMTMSNIIFIICYTVFTISVTLCCVLILPVVIATVNTPLNLACMAVECYIAICHPLHHMQVCTIKRTFMALGLIWMITMSSALSDLFITFATQPLGYFFSKVFCRKEVVFPHPFIVTKRTVTHSAYLVLVWITIFYTYLKILFTAKGADKDIKKARNTILLHGFQLLLCIFTYAAPPLTDALIRWFPRHFTDSLFANYVIVQMLPRAISPIIYGIRDNTFRKALKGHLLRKINSY